MGWYIGIGFTIVFVGYIVYSYNKIKNIKDVPPGKNIRILDNKNFKNVVRSGLILVDFWAPWCAPCKIVAPVLNEIAEEYQNEITIAKLNVDRNQQLAQKYKIRNIPSMILFRDGKELKRIIGVKSKKSILKETGISG